eukprot:XP_025012935.1 RPM1-interacting protein 4 isoform X1 [Ricinus communis]
MAQRSAVPKFGNWETEENVPYTVYFEKARKGNTAGKMKGNDPKQKPDTVTTKPSIQTSSFRMKSIGAQRGQEAVRSKHEQGGNNQQRRLRSVNRGDDSSDHSAAVPKFGDWDETNPASADGYTHIFNKVREEKQGGPAKVPVQPTESSRSNGHHGNENSKKQSCCCFPWG